MVFVMFDPTGFVMLTCNLGWWSQVFRDASCAAVGWNKEEGELYLRGASVSVGDRVYIADLGTAAPKAHQP
jgi:hypothetical protein